MGEHFTGQEEKALSLMRGVRVRVRGEFPELLRGQMSGMPGTHELPQWKER